MTSFYPYLLLILIFGSLLLEGLGIPSGRNLIFIIILVLPVSLFLHILILKRKLLVPRLITVLFLIFILSTLISTIFSVNLRNSIPYLFYIVSLYIVFLLTYNFQTIKKPLIYGMFCLAILYSAYSLFLSSGIFPNLLPQNGYQFVYAGFLAHNHLGDFLALSIASSFYLLYKFKYVRLSILCLAAFIPLIILSYSRSAYISIAASIFIIHVFSISKIKSYKLKILFRGILLIIILSTLFLSIATSRQGRTQLLSSATNRYLVKNEGLKRSKDIFGNRPEYIRQSLISIKKNPLTGVGPNNFLSVSRKYSNNPLYGATENTHNIFLEVAVGQGLLGLASFLLIIVYIFINSKKNILFVVFTCMLVNFQTDYTYNIYSFLLLFFVIGGLIYQEKSVTKKFKIEQS